MIKRNKKLLLAVLGLFGIDGLLVSVEQVQNASADSKALADWVSMANEKLQVLYQYAIDLVNNAHVHCMNPENQISSIAQQAGDFVEAPVEALLENVMPDALAQGLASNVDVTVTEVVDYLIDQVRSRTEGMFLTSDSFSAVEVDANLILTFPSFYDKLPNEVISIVEVTLDGKDFIQVRQSCPVNDVICLSVSYNLLKPLGLLLDLSRPLVIDRNSALSEIVVTVAVTRDSRVNNSAVRPHDCVVSIFRSV